MRAESPAHKYRGVSAPVRTVCTVAVVVAVATASPGAGRKYQSPELTFPSPHTRTVPILNLPSLPDRPSRATRYFLLVAAALCFVIAVTRAPLAEEYRLRYRAPGKYMREPFERAVITRHNQGGLRPLFAVFSSLLPSSASPLSDLALSRIRRYRADRFVDGSMANPRAMFVRHRREKRAGEEKNAGERMGNLITRMQVVDRALR